ncbi:TVP38/TMEM64 family protein [Acetobacter indonesiensis]|uniref:TVP38/TMEM64 family protein n=1 Tax=Acetobacter indonesiensis TaxID=104101 RepID=UPI0020A44827|nr:VTT domain-containing protein [Acetobacter indonesiensis]MCP1230203.1 VTT domain-containing protein [Acetobacter indonesiensis]
MRGVTSDAKDLDPACGLGQDDASGARMEQPDRATRLSDTSPVTRFLRPLLMLGLLVAGALLMRNIPALHHMLDSTVLLRDGIKGRMMFLAGASLWCAFGLPRQVAGFAAGLAYGVGEGTLMITLASTLGCVAGFFWARWGGQAWARARLGTRFARLDAMLSQQPFISILTLRLLPVGSALLLNLLGGVSGMKVLPFIAATVLGGLPQNLVAVLLGSGIRVDATWQAVLGGGLFIVSALFGMWLWRKARIMALMPESQEKSERPV